MQVARIALLGGIERSAATVSLGAFTFVCASASWWIGSWERGFGLVDLSTVVVVPTTCFFNYLSYYLYVLPV